MYTLYAFFYVHCTYLNRTSHSSVEKLVSCILSRSWHIDDRNVLFNTQIDPIFGYFDINTVLSEFWHQHVLIMVQSLKCDITTTLPGIWHFCTLHIALHWSVIRNQQKSSSSETRHQLWETNGHGMEIKKEKLTKFKMGEVFWISAVYTCQLSLFQFPTNSVSS